MRRRSLLSLAGSVALLAGARTGGAGAADVAGTATPPAGAAAPEEPALEPGLAIIDAHHHFMDWPALPGRAARRYLLPDLLADIERSGHRVTQTVFAECHAMYRASGPEEMKPVGETEFVNGIAAMAASGRYGACRAAAAIIGSADLRLGRAVRPVLEAQIHAGNGRLRGIRIATQWVDLPIFGQPPNPAFKGLLADARVRQGGELLGELGLCWDLWVFHTQLPELIGVADALPRCTFVLNHAGSPLDIGPFAGRAAEVFATWRAGMRELARRPNVRVKLGGMGTDFTATVGRTARGASSEVLAVEWRPRIEACIEAFGVERCLFESNFPPNAAIASYGATWNAFKRVTAGYSAAEKASLYAETARRTYRMDPG